MGIGESLEREGFFTTKLKHLIEWAIKISRKNSQWPIIFGTACCSIELMSLMCSRYDLSRFGAEVLRFSPRQADVLIVGGRVTLKMMPVLQRVWRQMAEPKWCISMGACASSGGVFDTYSMIQGVDKFVPVDVYVPGCPPRPENMVDALLMIQKQIDESKIL